MDATCRRCTQGMHCHGTLVRHGNGDSECTQDGCPGEIVVHDFVVDCFEVFAICCEPLPLSALLAS